MTPSRPRWRVGVLAALVFLGLAAGAAGQARTDFANACAPLISLATMTPPPGETGEVVRRLQTIAVGIARSEADVIVSAYADGARIENFPRLLPGRGAVEERAPGLHAPMGKEELRRAYRAYFQNVPEAAVVFTQVTVSVQGAQAVASARARFILPAGSGRDAHTATVTWKLARGLDGWRIIAERHQD